MKSNRWQMLLVEIIVALFVLLFLYTAVSKLKDIGKFEGAMISSEMIGRYAKILSWGVPAAEVAVALLLIVPRTRFAGLVGATLMMILFTGYIAAMLISNSKLPCTCGGVIEMMSWREHLVFNGAGTVLGVTGIIFYAKNAIMINRSSRIPV